MSDAELLHRAAELHATFPALDGHVDLPADITVAELFDGAGDRSQFDLPKAGQGGISAAVLTVHAPAGRESTATAASGRDELTARYRVISGLATEHADRVAVVRSPAELTSAFADRQFAVVLGLQNAAPLDGLAELDAWLDRGVSIVGFTFIGNNQWADSARPYPFVRPTSFGGLSDLGRDGVRRLNQRGVVVDVSQLSSAAFRDVLATTTAPVLASHSAARHFVDADRNISDAELEALHDNGGLLQVVGFGPYLRPDGPELTGRLEALWRQYGVEVTGRPADLLSVNDPITATWDDEKFWTFLHEFHVVLELDKPLATTRDLADHVEYVGARLGLDHVGISSDFNHAGGLADWMHSGQSLSVTAELLRRGHREADIAQLWSGNFLRLWQAVLDRADAP
jgi:microsomal dipeptidase-like Zn-dependent dipeptidase